MVKHIVLIAAAMGCVMLYETAAAKPVDRRLFTSDAVYELHVSNSSFRQCDVNKDGAFQPGELACYDAVRWGGVSIEPMRVSGTPRRRVSEPLRMSPASDSGKEMDETQSRFGPTGVYITGEDGKPKQKSCTNLREDALGPKVGSGDLILRRSKPDVGTWIQPNCFNRAFGAEFAWADDRIDQKEVWSARGLIAYPIHIDETVTIAPYIGFDRTSKAEAAQQLIDDLSYGGALEFSIAKDPNIAQLINIDAGLLTDFNGDGKNWGINLTWKPKGKESSKGNGTLTYLGRPLKPQGGWFSYTLSPVVETGFLSEISQAALQPIFAERDLAFRSGATVTFKVDGTENAPWSILENIQYEFTYGWLYDWLSERDYALLDTALRFGLNEDGLVGLTFSYRKGELEATGQDVDLVKAALSVGY